MEKFEKQILNACNWAAKAAKLHSKPILSYQQMMAYSKGISFERGSSFILENILGSSHKATKLYPRPDVLPLLEESLKIQSDNVIVRNAYIAVLAPRWGGSLEALQEYSKASAHPGLSPDRITSVIYSATMEIASDYWFNKELDRAAEIYQEASKICKLNAPLIEIANIRISQGRYAEALKAADDAVALVPNGSSANRMRAYALLYR